MRALKHSFAIVLQAAIAQAVRTAERQAAAKLNVIMEMGRKVAVKHAVRGVNMSKLKQVHPTRRTTPLAQRVLRGTRSDCVA